MKVKSYDIVASISLLGAALLWAGSFSAMKVALTAYDPMVVVFARMLIGSLCFLLGYRWLRGTVVRGRDWALLLIMALCEPGLYFLFEAKALTLTTSSQAGMISATLPLLVAVAAGLFLKERITRRALLGLGLAIAGVCWLSVSGETRADAPNPLLGNFLEFLAMVFAAGYTICLKLLSRRYSVYFLTAFQSFVGAVFFLPFMFLPATNLPTALVPLPALAVLYLGTGVTMGAYGLFNFGLSRIPANQAAAFVNLIPVFAVFLGWLVLEERFTSQQYLASLLVFLGIYINQRGAGAVGKAAVAEPVAVDMI